MSSEHANKPELFIDNERYDWDKPTITGAEIKALAGLPDDVEIYWKGPRSEDTPVEDATVIDLSIQSGPDRFSSQPVGSQAGA